MKWRLIFVLLLLPFSAAAQISITEIIYDFPGTEGKSEHEWIEVINNGSSPVDISAYKFFENNTNHGLTLSQGSPVLAPGAFAIIANATSTFLADWPDFTGTLFDSSFSLNSTRAGESLAIRAGDGTEEDSITYSSDWGAKDDGNSLQKNSGGAWTASLPTPGAAISADTGYATGIPAETGIDTASIYVPTPKQTIVVDAGMGERTAVASASIAFKAKARGLEGEQISNARFLWSFGDGGTGEGAAVFHAYRYPGEYAVFLEGSSAGYSASDRVKVIIVPANITIDTAGTSDDFFVSLKNGTNYDIDLSGWSVVSGESTFFIPENTVVLSGKSVMFPQGITELQDNDVVALSFPDGKAASVYERGKSTSYAPASSENSGTTGESAPIRDIPVHGEISIEDAAENTSGDPTFTEESQYAASEGAFASLLPTVTSWSLALVGLIVVGITTALLVRRKKTPADEFEVFEERK